MTNVKSDCQMNFLCYNITKCEKQTVQTDYIGSSSSQALEQNCGQSSIKEENKTVEVVLVMKSSLYFSMWCSLKFTEPKKIRAVSR